MYPSCPPAHLFYVLRELDDGGQRAGSRVALQVIQGLGVLVAPLPDIDEGFDRLVVFVFAFERQVVLRVGVKRRVEVDEVDARVGDGAAVLENIQAVGGEEDAVHGEYPFFSLIHHRGAGR